MAKIRAFTLAFPCPRCRRRETTTLKTEADDAYLVRQRHCHGCGLDFDTYEIPAAALAALMDRAGAARPEAA